MVRTIQHLLRHHGYAVVVDGEFGAQTDGAVRAFQRDHGLTADGVVGGQETWPALVVTVRRGDQGEAVRAVQSQLRTRGFTIAVDGLFGDQTDQVLSSYQQSRGLTADGVVGAQETWPALV